jgi:hypothetical protein
VDKKTQTVAVTTQDLKQRCGIPDSVNWGDPKIFLYEEGVKKELARLDSIIEHNRKLKRRQ